VTIWAIYFLVLSGLLASTKYGGKPQLLLTSLAVMALGGIARFLMGRITSGWYHSAAILFGALYQAGASGF